jgi:hypothetical protein
MTKRYNHAFDFAFEVETVHKNPDRIATREIRYRLIERAARISDKELREAIGCYDTFEIDEPQKRKGGTNEH